MVQTPGQCLRDFACDCRAMCLKWNPDIAEVLRRILNSCNPTLAGCLRGTVKTVGDLVKVGSMVEKDWASKKDYWAKVKNCPPPKGAAEKTARKTKEGTRSEFVAVHAKPRAVTPLPLLVVPIAVKDHHGDAAVDTGCTFSLMKESLWMKLRISAQNLSPCEV